MSRTTSPAVRTGAIAELAQPTVAIDGELELRPWTVVDAPAVLAAFSTPDIVYWHAREMNALDQAQAWIEDTLEAWQSERSCGWAIVHRATGEVVGRCALHVDLAEGVAEIGYWVLPGHRGHQVAARAAVAATTWAHGIGFQRVELEHSVRNERSCVVADRAGFTFEGTKRGSARHADGIHDMHLHAHVSGDPLPSAQDRPVDG